MKKLKKKVVAKVVDFLDFDIQHLSNRVSDEKKKIHFWILLTKPHNISDYKRNLNFLLRHLLYLNPRL